VTIVNKFITLIKKFFWPLTLVAITLSISILNFDSEKWLTGWDTLHPEFDLQLHVYRSIFGVWREDQGLGTLAAHSHMSELPRILILWFLSFIFPINILRIVFIFICFILGPLGIFYFTKKAIFKDNTYKSNVSSFLASLIFIFNLGTVQHFYVVFEMFAVQYATIGFIFLFTHKILYESNKKNVAVFYLISFLSAPMAYASQLWFALFGGILLYIGTILFLEKEKKVFLKKIGQILFIFISANLFWLLPNLYFLTSGASKTPIESHINRIFSQESYLYNSAYGTVENIAILKNFLFNWQIYDFTQLTFVSLLGSWNKHLENQFVLIVGYLIFFIALIGIIKSFIKKEKELIGLFLVFLMSIFVLMNSNFPFDTIFNLLRENLSLFREGLRTPFTKFSILTMFTISIFFAVAINWISNKYTTLILFIVSSSLIIYGFPMFQGELISKKIYNSIPPQYFEFFAWSKKQPEDARIALLPVNNFVGWEYNKWGYQGAGFIWFGIKQPLLTRDFDRWSRYNETFYNEISTAIYGNDLKHLENIIKKYNLSFILLDESKIEPNSTNPKITRNDEIKLMLTKIDAKEVWKRDFLSVYDLREISKSHSGITAPLFFSKVISDNEYTRRDIIYENSSSYLGAANMSIYYPFSYIDRTYLDGLIYQRNNILFNKLITENVNNYNLIIPPIAEGSKYKTQVNFKYVGTKLEIFFDENPTIYLSKQTIKTPQLPKIDIQTLEPLNKIIVNFGDKQIQLSNGESKSSYVTLEVNKPIQVEYYDYSKVQKGPNGYFVLKQNTFSKGLDKIIWNDLTSEKKLKINNQQYLSLTLGVNTQSQNLDILNTYNCNQSKSINSFKSARDNAILFYSKDNDFICEGLNLETLSQENTYLMRWRYLNESGRTFKFFFKNITSDRIDLEELLPEKNIEATYSIVSWPFLKEEGYKLTFENRSLGQETSNRLNAVEFYAIPDKFIRNIRFEPENYQKSYPNKVLVTSKKKFANFLYSAEIQNNFSEGMFYIDQGYDRGWVGLQYGLQGIDILKHGKYNGWSNGWELPKGEYKVLVIYWPQLLSFLGFIFFGYSFVLVLYRLWKKDLFHIHTLQQ